MENEKYKRQAEQIMKIAEENGVQGNFLFTTTFDRYLFLLDNLENLKEQIQKEGMTVQKEYIKGRDGIVGARDKKEIGIHAVRGGTIVGEHEVIFAGEDEVITISHSATSKRVFAVGAIRAAKFLNGKVAGRYAMKDLLGGE